MRIRAEQFEALEQAAALRFRQRTPERIKQKFPKHCRFLGEEGLRKKFDDGCRRAASYRLTADAAVEFFIELMFLTGDAFDTDPQLPWAAEILNDGSGDQAARVDRLYDEAMQYLNSVSGPDNEFIDEALVRARELRIERFFEPDPWKLGNIVVAHLRALYREKADYIGERPLRALVARGQQAASDYNITGGGGVTMYVILMYLLGSGFDKDPQFAWAASVLNDRTIAHENERIERLRYEAIGYLDQWYA